MAASKKLDLKEILFPTLSLFLICFVMTGALAIVNEITKDRIAASEKGVADLAREEIFPGARFVDNGAYFTAMDQNGTHIGYCVESEAQGYGGVIKVMTALTLEGGVLRVRVLSCDGETPGLGQKIKGEGFLAQFIGGKDAVEVDSIASATYSSQGVADAVNVALEIYREVIAQ